MVEKPTTFRLLVPAIVVIAGGLAVIMIQAGEADPPPNNPANIEHQSTTGSVTELHPIIIDRPDGPPAVDTGLFDANGQAVTANCTTCHATRQPDFAITDGAQLIDFHQGLITQHGDLTCLTCHNPDDYSALRRADGTSLPFTEVMQLCAQCHGPQYRDYVNGSHGGMTGYWDLSRGPRVRNHCIVCHDPHAPQYPQVMPVFKPRDRFLTPHDSLFGTTKEELHD